MEESSTESVIASRTSSLPCRRGDSQKVGNKFQRFGSKQQRLCFKSSNVIYISFVASLLCGVFLAQQQSNDFPFYGLRSSFEVSDINDNNQRIFMVEKEHHRFLEEKTDQCTKDWCIKNIPDNELCPSENAWIEAIPFPLQMIIMIILLMFSAIFSGLTLGLMSLDCTGLEIVMEGEDEKNAQNARKIYGVRKDGNLLLCTLLLGNVLVNAFLSILMGELFGGIIALVGSTIMIVIFGEIVPQALCSRYALQIGSVVVPLVRVIMFLIYPFAYPMAWALNMILGEELVTTYSSGEMRKLLQIHVAEGRFDQETGQAMAGALAFKEMSVKDVMTPREKTFMLNVDERLNFATIAKIFKTGYSRIPVYAVSTNNIIGLLFVKDLIFIDPEDETPVRSFVQIFGRGVHVVWPDEKLGDVLRELKKGKSHMALVRDVNNDDEKQDPFYEIKGIITLEDIIEEIIGDEIVDETDAFVDSTQLVKVNRNIGNSDTTNFDWGRLRLLDAKIVEQCLSHEEAKAVTAHLRINYSPVFQLLSDHQLYRLVSEATVEELAVAKHKELNNNSTIDEEGLPVLSDEDWLYRKGIETDVCTLILGGKVTVLAGVDKFRSDLSSWSVLGGATFTEPSYKPDFSAFVSGSSPCRCLCFTKERFHEAIDTSAMERHNWKGILTTTPKSSVTIEMTPTDQTDDAVPSAVHPIDEPDTQGKRRENSVTKRNKFIAALRQKVSPTPAVIAEDDEENNSIEQPQKKISFAPPESGGLNSVLTEGGTYQPKPLDPSTITATTTTNVANGEFVSLHFDH